ncbi:hypothetical protein HPSA20_0947 [Helicobacter pylori SouthAfrica20]|uniref:Uncharacterized protein n=1 Tax=Helicobacter pylori SouthAfrica20 TaxID=1352356 RepID=T1UB93_HELPX|nr:hypothetical protein HPSA20_0947 [Helicobacter pylori SouthAfrica20]
MSSLKKQRLSIVLPLNETKNAKSKKILKFFKNDKKKKRFYAIMPQIHINVWTLITT